MVAAAKAYSADMALQQPAVLLLVVALVAGLFLCLKKLDQIVDRNGGVKTPLHTLPPFHHYTKTELRTYDGTDGKPILVAVKGRVYDMTSHPSGQDFYSASGAYGAFAGNDVTRALATMQFDDVGSNTLTDLDTSEIEVLDQWIALYESKYAVVGSFEEYRSTKYTRSKER